jgi:hypothetical protein
MLSISKTATTDDIEEKFYTQACINLEGIKNVSQDCIVMLSYSIFYKPQMINGIYTKIHINSFSNYLTFYSDHYSKYQKEYAQAMNILKNSGHLLLCYFLKNDMKQGLINSKDVITLEASGMKDNNEPMNGLVNYYQRMGFNPIETNPNKLDMEIEERYVPMISNVKNVLNNCFKTQSNPQLLQVLDTFFEGNEEGSYSFDNSKKGCQISSLCTEELEKEDVLHLMDLDKEFLNFAIKQLKNNKRVKGAIINKKIQTTNIDFTSKQNHTFFDILSTEDFPSVIGLVSIPQYFKNFFLITNRGILCIRPYSVRREDIKTSKMDFSKSFSTTKHGYTIHYKTWGDLEKCL